MENSKIEKVCLWTLGIGAILSLVRSRKLKEKEAFFVSFRKLRETYPDVFGDEKLYPLCGYEKLPQFAKDWINELFSDGIPPLQKLETELNNLDEQQKSDKKILQMIDSLSRYFIDIEVINNGKISFII